MPGFIVAWLLALGPIFTNAIARVALAFGVGFAVYTGMDAVLDQVHSLALAQYGALPSAVVGMLGLMRVDQALNLILSAVAVRLTLEGLTGGGLRKLVWKEPAA